MQEAIDDKIGDINTRISKEYKKGVRKTVRYIDRWCKYSKNKSTEVELRFHFLKRMTHTPYPRAAFYFYASLLNRQFTKTTKIVSKLHEDLQFEYKETLEEIYQELPTV